MKIYNKLKKGLALSSLLTLGLSTIVVPLVTLPTVAYADGDDNEDVAESMKSEGSGKISATTNGAIFAEYRDRSKYNFGVQYATTYNYLLGTYLNNKEYSDMYVSNGQTNAFKVGLGEYLTDENKPNIGQDPNLSRKDIEGDTSLDDKPKEDDATKPESVEELNIQLTNLLEKKLHGSVAYHYGVNINFKPRQDSEWGWKTKRFFTYEYDGTLKTGTGVNPSNKADETARAVTKNFLTQTISSSTVEETRDNPKKLTEELRKNITYNTLGNYAFAPTTSPLNTSYVPEAKKLNGSLNDNSWGGTYGLNIQNKTPQNAYSKAYYTNYGGSPDGTMTKDINNKKLKLDVKIPPSHAYETQGLKLAMYNGTDKEITSNFNNTYNTSGAKEDALFLEDMFKYRYEKGYSKASEFNRQVDSALNNKDSQEIITKMSEKLKDTQKELDDAGDKNSKLIAYSPLQVYNDNTTKDLDVSKYNDLLEKEKSKLNDLSSSTKEAEIIDKDSNPRALRLSDFAVNGSESKLMSGDKSNVRGYPIGSTDGGKPLKSTKSLRQYYGTYYPQGGGKAKVYNTQQLEGISKKGDYHTNGNAMYKAISASTIQNNATIGNAKMNTSVVALGLDNYGNLIATETGDIFIPYWQNNAFVKSDNKISANNVLKSNDDALVTSVLKNSTLFNLGDARQIALNNAKGDASDNFTDKDAVIANINGFMGGVENENLEAVYNKKMRELNPQELSTLAMIITLSTYKDIENFNKKFIVAIESGTSFYVYPGETKFLTDEQNDKDKLTRWTAASLIQKIGWLFDYGFYELVRLTTAQMSVSIYDAIGTWVGNIFYTDNITTSYAWQGMSNAIAGFFLAFIIVYSLYLAFNIFRKTVSGKDGIKKILALSIIMIIPVFGYNWFTDFMLNKPANFVIEDIVKQGLVVSFLEDKKEGEKSIMSDEMANAYEEIFGMNQANTEFTTKNYLMTFYTNTNRKGQNVQDLPKEDLKLNNWWKNNSKTTNTVTNQYNRKQLVPVNASIFDMYVWSTEQVYAREGVPSSKGESIKKEDYSKETFFQYLANKYPEDYGELGSYTEYEIDLSTLYENDVLSTGIFKDDKSNSKFGFDNSLDTGKITASELFYLLQKNSLNATDSKNPEYKLQQGLRDLKNLTRLFGMDYKYTTKDGYYMPNAEDLDIFIRDLSMTKESRKQAYGSSDDMNFSDFTLSVFGKTDKFKLPTEVNQNYIPQEDYFGIYTTISQLMANQGRNQANYKFDNAKKSTYKVSSRTLSTMSKNYGNMESIFNLDSDNFETDSALQMSILLELYFNLNKELGFKNFPTSYNAKSVKFDTLLKLYYIPMKYYNFQSYQISELSVRTLMEYVTLQENVLFIAILFVAIVFLIVFWLLYAAVFEFVMLFIILYKFIKEYIVMNNYSNKSWLGSFYIYATFSLLRLGLACIWWLGYTIINTAMASYGGLIYNIVFMHSLFIITYILLAFKFALIPLFKAVLEDKDNLGANAVTSNLNNVRNNISMKSLGKGLVRSPMNFAKSASRNLKRAKNITKGGYKASRWSANKLSRGAKFGAGKIADTKTAQALGSKLATASKSMVHKVGGDTLVSKVYSKHNENLTEAEKLTAKDGSIVNAQYNKYRLKHERKKLNKKMKHDLKTGDLIEGASKLGTTILELENIPQELLATKGEQMATHLASSMGIMAKVVEKTTPTGQKYKALAVDSTAHDLATEEGRSAVTLGLRNFANSTKQGYNKSFRDIDLEDIENFNQELPLFSRKDKSSFLIDTSSKYGIDRDTMKEVFDEKTLVAYGFDKEFEQITNKYDFKPATYTDSNGNTAINESKYVIYDKKGRSVSEQEAHKIMSKVSKIDEAIRTRRNKPLRDVKDMADLTGTVYNFSNEELDIVKERIAGTQGLTMLDNNTIIATTGQGTDELKAIQRETLSNQKVMKNSLQSFSNDLSAYSKDGEGHGLLKTSVYNSQNHKSDVERLMGNNYGNEHSYVMALDNTNATASNTVLNSLNTASSAATMSKDEDFMEAIRNKDMKRRELKKGINKALNQDRNTLANSLQFIREKDSQLAKTPIFKEIEKDLNNLIAKEKEGALSDETFNSIYPYLSMQMAELLEHSSLMEGFANVVDFENVDGISNVDRDGLVKDIIKSKEQIKKSLRLDDIRDVDKQSINGEYVDKMVGIFGDNGGFTVNPYNNTAIIGTDNNLNINNSTDNKNLLADLVSNDYQRILNTNVSQPTTSNDSEIVTKYLSSIPSHVIEESVGKAPKKSIKEEVVTDPSVILDFVQKPVDKTVVEVPKQVKNVAQELTDKKQQVLLDVNRLQESLSIRESRGEVVPQSEKETIYLYKQAVMKLDNVVKDNGFMENKGKTVKLLSDLEQVEKEVNSALDKLPKNDSDKPKDNPIINVWNQ